LVLVSSSKYFIVFFFLLAFAKLWKKILGFDANNKKIFLRNPELTKDLSIGNAAAVNWCSTTYP
jgi:hypothetical protein